MLCKKCNAEIPNDSAFCCYCGYKIHRERKKTRTANGSGYAFKRGQTWTVRVTTGWKELESGKKTPIQSYKGGFKTKREALEYVSVLKNPEVKKKELPTFEKLFHEWYKFYTESRKLAKSTVKGYTTAFGHMDQIKPLPVDQITPATIQGILNEDGMSHRMKELIKSVLKMSFNYAMDEYHLDKSPVRNLYLGENDSEQRPPLTDEELELIKSHFEDELYAKYVYAMAYLGFRPTAFFNLQKTDFHFEDGVYYLVGGIKSEAGKGRIVTIPPKILPIIQERLAVEGTDLIFPRYSYRGGFQVMNESYFSQNVFKPMAKRIKLPEGRVPYSARHTYSNKIKNAAGAERDKADLMGHTDYKFTQKKYQTSTVKERQKITDQLE